ncbi:MAG: hypothetical protein FWE03_06640 [Firmicutes bacterium]|nr:hypothetical protein [Bacillota bacterium]
MNQTVLSFFIGVIIAIFLVMIFSIKKKGLIKFIINLAAGATALILLVVFNVYPFTLSPLTAFLIGVLGAPGLAVIFIILMIL